MAYVCVRGWKVAKVRNTKKGNTAGFGHVFDHQPKVSVITESLLTQSPQSLICLPKPR